MADDALDYEIVFKARLDAGNTATQLERILVTLENLEAQGALTTDRTEAISKAFIDQAESVSALRSSYMELGKQMEVVGKDARQNLAGLFETGFNESAASTKAASDQLKAYMQQSKGLSSVEAELTLNAGQWADAERERVAQDSRVLRDYLLEANKVVEAQAAMEAGGKFTASPTYTPNSSAAEYDAQLAAQEKAAQERSRALQESMQQRVGGMAEGPYAATAKGDEAAIKAETSAREKELATLKQDIIERNNLRIAEENEAKALAATLPEADAQVKAYEARNRQLEIATKQQAIYNQYLYDQKKAQAASAASSSSSSRGLGNFYPLIVSAGIFAGISKATLGLGADAVKTAAQYQQAFASVARTTQTEGGNAAGQIEYIRQSLLKLSTQIPLTFEDLSKIAAAGNEAGVSASGILDFTRTVAEYSTVTGTSIETTTQAFGGLNAILHLNNAEYSQLGSAISYVGRMSVASEPEIVSMLNQMASAGQQAGLTNQQIVGLAGSFASLKIAPEAARSALQSYTKTLNTALAGGTKHGGIAEWAKILGMSPADASKLAQTNANAFLQKFLTVLNSSSSVGKTQIFADLGLNNARTTNAFARLSGSIPLLKQLLDDANASWAKGTDLQTQYAKATDTLTAKWKEMQDAIKNLMGDLGNSGLAEELMFVVDGLKNIVVGVDGFVKANPKVANFVLAMLGIVGALTAVKSAMIGTQIAATALSWINDGERGMTFAKSLGVLAQTFLHVGGTSKVAAAGLAEEAAAAELAGAATATGAEEAGAGISAGARTAGAGVGAGVTMATVGLAAIGIAIGSLITWLITDFPGAMRFATSALGFFADAFIATEPVVAGFAQFVANNLAMMLDVATPILDTMAVIFTPLITVIGGTVEAVSVAVDWIGSHIQDLAFLWDQYWSGITQRMGIAGQVISNIAGVIGDILGGLGNLVGGFFNTVFGASSIVGKLNSSIDSAQKSLKTFGSSKLDFSDQNAAIQKFVSGTQGWAKGLKDSTGQTKAAVPNLKDYAKAIRDAGAGGDQGAKGIKNAGDAAKKAAVDIRTAADYASDLSSVFKRANDIKFGPSNAKDAVVTQFQTMRDAANQARNDIKKAHDTIKSLEADISKKRSDNTQQRYFLDVANQFGDAASAQQAQANIDSNNAAIGSDNTQLIQAQKDAASAQDKLNTSTSSNTAGAIANRAALQELYKKYQDYITALAASGANQTTLDKAVKSSKASFDKQAGSLGYSKGAIDKVSSGFNGMIGIIKHIPPANISISGMSASQAAMTEFLTKLKAKVASAAGAMTNSLSTIGNGVNSINMPKVINNTNDPAVRRKVLEDNIAGLSAQIAWMLKNNQIGNGLMVKMADEDRIRRNLRDGNYYSGGYTGPGGKYEPAGVVHKGEYVVPANMVNQQTGLPMADALGRLIAGTRPQASYAGGGFVNPDMMVVEPGPKFMREMRNMVQQEVIAVISPDQIASASNSANAAQRRRGRG